MLSTAAGMPGLLHISTLIVLVASCDAFRLMPSSQRVIPLSPPLFQGRSFSRPYFFQELVRTKRQSVHELVRVQPHLIHDMGWPDIQEVSQAKKETTNSSQPIWSSYDGMTGYENVDVEDEMKDAERHQRQTDSLDQDTRLVAGPRAGDVSQEASGFYGMDTEDRGEDRGEDRERRAEEEEWERETEEDRERRGGDTREEEGGGGTTEDVVKDTEDNHTTPDLDALIGYSPSLQPSSSKQPSVLSPAAELESGPQEHRASAVLEGPQERDLWEAEGDDGRPSGYDLLRSSTATATSAATAAGETGGTSTPETDTGTDFELLAGFSKEDRGEEEEEEEESDLAGAFTQSPTVPAVGNAPSREPLQPSMKERDLRSDKDRGGAEEEEEGRRRTLDRAETRIRHIVPLTTSIGPDDDATWDWLESTTPLHMEEAQKVLCVEWSQLTARGYVTLNMMQNMNCEEFRADQGVRLLRVMERVFARRMNSPEGSWLLYLSKPTHQQHQLLMNVASEHGVISTQDVLGMLGEIRQNLNEVGIQNYSAASTCQSRPSQTRSDYSKLFVVLVIIGSVCMVIITSGFIYICWQRRLPAAKSTFRAEELHFVENGCHDNPTLDVVNESQPEMQEKKPSTNGLTGGEGGGGEQSSRWQVFVNQAATQEEDEEEEEQDTHL